MLAFLDALCAALRQRNADVVRQLMTHPLASALPATVRGEADLVIRGVLPDHVAPLATLQLYHQTAHFLGMSREARERGGRSLPAQPAARRSSQIELPLQVA